MTLTLKAGCALLAMSLSLGAAQAATSDAATTEAADARIDAALAGAEACPLVFDVAAAGPGQMEILLLAPCHAGENVVLDHVGMVLRVSTSNDGTLSASLPMLDAESPVTLTFADGTMADALMAPPPVTEAGTVAVRW